MAKRKKSEHYFSHPTHDVTTHYLSSNTAFSTEEPEGVQSDRVLPCSPTKKKGHTDFEHRGPSSLKPQESAPSTTANIDDAPSTTTNTDNVAGDGKEEEDESKKKRERDPRILPFYDKIDEIVLELLRHEALDPTSSCSTIGCTAGSDGSDWIPYRCGDCNSMLYCKDCIVGSHAQHPFHIIERWTGSFFERVSLKSQGLHVQLNHPPGEACPFPRKAHDNAFMVFDTNGIHEVGLDYCTCFNAPTPFCQLLQSRLFPASTIDPKTAATLRCLKMFQMFSFVSKISGFEFVRALSVMTSGEDSK